MHDRLRNCRWLAILIGVALVPVVWRACRADEGAEVRELVDHLAGMATFQSPLPPLELLTEAKRFSRYFHPDAVITYHGAHPSDGEEASYSARGRPEIIRLATAGRKELAEAATTATQLTVTFRVDPDGHRRAEITGEGRLLGRLPGREDFFLEQHRFRAEAVKISGNWQIATAENLPDRGSPE